MIGTNSKRIDLDTLRAELQGIEAVKCPPSILQEILLVVENPRSGAKEVENIVERDMSCSLKLLKLANSAYYGFSRQVKTIREAIVIIGLDGVKNVAMSLAVADAFKKGTPAERKFLEDLWVHSMATATAASMLAKEVASEISPSLAYCSGLVHDIGKVIFKEHFGANYMEVFGKAREGKLPISLVEEDELGVDHARVGGWVADAWDLPEVITWVLREHHSKTGPWDRAEKPIGLLALADAIAYESKAGHGGNFKPRRTDHPTFASLGVDDKTIKAVQAEIIKRAGRFGELLRLAG